MRIEKTLNWKLILIFLYVVIASCLLFKGNKSPIEVSEQVELNDDNQTAILCSIDNLPFGVYSVDINYRINTKGANRCVAYVSAEGEVDTSNIMICDMASLLNYKTSESMRIYVKAFKGSGHINITGYAVENESIVIDSVSVYDQGLWRYGLLLIIPFVFIILCYLKRTWMKLGSKDIVKAFIVVLTILFASFPALIGNKGVYFGHDLEFHINRIVSIANEITSGNFPAFYQHDAKMGGGYIALIMYGNILLYIPALLYCLGMSLSAVYNLYIVFINIITCIIALYSFKGIFKKDKYAIIGMTIYMLLPYRLLDIYIRQALGEYTAMSFLPLIVYGIYRIYYEDEKGLSSIMPLIIGVTGVVESHLLTTEMVIPFVLVFALVHWRETIKKSGKLVAAAIIVIILNLFFLVPFLSQYRQELMINSNSIPTSDLTTSGLFIPQIFDIFIYPTGAVEYDSTLREMPLQIGIALAIGMVLFLAVIIVRKEIISYEEKIKKGFLNALEIFIYGGITLFMTTCSFPWREFQGKQDFISKLFTSTQYTWRYLCIADLFLTIVTVYSVYVIIEHGNDSLTSSVIHIMNNKSATIIGVLIFATILTTGDFFTGFTHNTPLEKYHYIGSSTFSDWIYLPYGCDVEAANNLETYIYMDNEEDSNVSSCEVANIGVDNKGDRWFSIANDGEACRVSLPVLYYDNLDITTNDGNVINTFSGKNCQVTFDCEPNFQGKIRVSFHVRRIWKLSYLISLISAILIIIVYYYKKCGNGLQSYVNKKK